MSRTDCIEFKSFKPSDNPGIVLNILNDLDF